MCKVVVPVHGTDVCTSLHWASFNCRYIIGVVLGMELGLQFFAYCTFLGSLQT